MGKKKNWFRRHWIVSIILGFMIIGMLGNIFDSSEDNSDITGDVVNEQVEEVKQICTPNWNCDSWSECSSSEIQIRICTDINNCGINSGKPSEKQTCVYDTSSNDWVEDLEESLEELEKEMSIYQKRKLCTELCARDSIDVPYIKNECSLACFQIYYYGGEEGLDEYIVELRE